MGQTPQSSFYCTLINTANHNYILSAVCFHSNRSPSSTVLVCTTKNTCGRKSAIIVTITFSWITFNTRSIISTQKLLWWGSGVTSQREREREKSWLCTTAAPLSQTTSWITKHLRNYSTILQRTYFLLLLLHCQHTRPQCFAGSRRDAKLTTPQSEEEGTGGDCPQSGTRTCNLSIPDPQSSE